MPSRQDRRSQRPTNRRPVPKSEIRRGNLIIAVMVLVVLAPVVYVGWRAMASGPTAQASTLTQAYGDTQTDPAISTDASTTTPITLENAATTSDVARMHIRGSHEVDAGNLKPGDAVLMKDGETRIVTAVDWESAPQTATADSQQSSSSPTDASSSDDPDWILAPDHVPPPLPNGEPAPLPVAQSDRDPGFHPLEVQDREVSGDKIILTGVNPATGKQETVIGKRGRDTVYDLGDPNSEDKTGVIQNVRTGDYVVTRNPLTGKNEFKQVTQTYKHLAYETITAQFADAKTGKILDTVTATPQHPFFVPGRGAIPLGCLVVGSQVVTRAGPPMVIASLVKHEYPQGIPVYNFEVQDDHTYFVGNARGGAWVHNTCGSGGSPALDGDPYSPAAVEARIRPPYDVNLKHVPGSGSFLPRADVLPSDAAAAYAQAEQSPMGTWWSQGEQGWYRYFSDNAGTAHYSGTFPANAVPAWIVRGWK